MSKDLRVREDHQVCRVHLVQLDKLDHKAPEDLMEQRVLEARRERKDPRELQDLMVFKEIEATEENLGLLDQLVQLDLKAPKAKVVEEEKLACLVKLDHQVLLDRQDHLGNLVLMETKAIRVLKDNRESEVFLDRQDPQVLLDHQAKLDGMVLLGKEVKVDLVDRPVKLESRAKLVLLEEVVKQEHRVSKDNKVNEEKLVSFTIDFKVS